MDWRHSTWARWLAWTGAFGLVLASSVLLQTRLPSPVAEIVFFGLQVMAAFLIGARFRFGWWAVGPAAAWLTLIVAMIIWSLLGPQVPRQTSFGMLTPRQQIEFLGGFFVLILGGGFLLLAVLLALPAYAGVRWGRHREEDGRQDSDNPRTRRTTAFEERSVSCQPIAGNDGANDADGSAG
jgi:hypothetical protein